MPIFGIGFSWWDADVYKGVDDDDTQFLLSPASVWTSASTRRSRWAAKMLFNVIPTGIHDDTPIDDQFYYSWEVVGLRVRF